MDRISLLPNDFLLQILSLLPTKDVLNTSVLSKQWLNLWKLVPKLEYIDKDENADHGRFLRFVDRSLLLNTAPVLESSHFKLGHQCSDIDIGFWIRTAVKRGLRELNFEYCRMIDEPARLPQSLFTCGTLVVLKIENVSLVDVQFPVSFQLLKTLHLVSLIYLDDESPQKLLSSCPVLEALFIERADNDNVTSFSVTIPSLQKFIYSSAISGSALVINTPSLKYLKISDLGDECTVKNMPEIVEAHVEVICPNVDDILRSLASVKRLLLCLPIEPPLPTGCIFHQLVHLEFCTCTTEWDPLMSMLQHSPKLRSLKLNETHGHVSRVPPWSWYAYAPSSVPETLMFVLETFEWRNYRGYKIEKVLAAFILKHSRRLKTATFSVLDNTQRRKELRPPLKFKFRVLTELARMPRGSAECELVFGDKKA